MQKGFTIIEVLVSASLILVIGAGLLGLQYIVSLNQLNAFNSYTSVEETNAIASFIARELRMASPSELGAYPLISALDQQIEFYADADFDGQTERLRYTLNGNTLERGIIEPTGFPVTYPSADENVRTMSENIRNGTDPVFLYFNENWPSDTVNNPLIPGTRVSDTRLIRINISANTIENNELSTYRIEAFVSPRSLKTN